MIRLGDMGASNECQFVKIHLQIIPKDAVPPFPQTFGWTEKSLLFVF